ncbi:MAG: hypothetical protein RI900_162 [Actinomycetota bacterium]
MGIRAVTPLAAIAALSMLPLASCRSATSDRDLALAAAVQVEAEGCRSRPSLGAGSFVAEGLVLTVAHVVAGSETVEVHLAGGRELDADVVAIDRVKDLALLRVDADVSPLPTRTMRAGEQGWYVVWRDDQPVAMRFSAQSYVDINAQNIDHTGVSPRKGYQITAEVVKGDSGAVLVADGTATAVIFARSTAAGGRAWATSTGEALPLLTSVGDSPVDVGDCPKG